jgi:multicomponent Na+:H+ antiporter subunit D
VAVLVVVGSLFALVYVWRIVETAYFKPAPEPDGAVAQEAPLTFLLPLWLLVAANIYFGIDTRLTVGITEMTAAYLFSTSLGN